MSIKGKAYIAGVYEHPTRKADGQVGGAAPRRGAPRARWRMPASPRTTSTATSAPATRRASGRCRWSTTWACKLRHVDSTDTGGSSYVLHVGHAAEAIAAGKCNVALITLAGRPRAEGMATGTVPRVRGGTPTPDEPFEFPYGPTVVNMYAHVRHAPHARVRHDRPSSSPGSRSRPRTTRSTTRTRMLRDVVTVEEVVNSPMIADPLHRLDCCVITDGGGAHRRRRRRRSRSQLKRPAGQGASAPARSSKTPDGRRGRPDLFRRALRRAPTAFAEAGVKPADIKYASIYDSFTITVLMQLEDLGFCEKGEGGAFVADGNLISGVGKLPFNTDGGGLCNNHPANRGGMTKVIEAVRQLRGEAHPEGAGEELRPRAGARHRRLARPAPRQRDRHPGEGVDHGRDQGTQAAGAGRSARRRRPIWDAAAQGQAAGAQVHELRRGASLSAHDLPVLLQRRDRVDRGVGQGHDLLLQRDAPRAGALRHRLRDAGRRPDA